MTLRFEIQKILSENLELSNLSRSEIRAHNTDATDVSDIGHKYFSYFYKENGLYKISKKGGYHKENVIKNQIVSRKIDQIIAYLQTQGATNIERAQTGTYYLFVKNIPVRISNHIKKSFEGIDVFIQWNTNMDELL
jgi:hypothetical protein